MRLCGGGEQWPRTLQLVLCEGANDGSYEVLQIALQLDVQPAEAEVLEKVLAYRLEKPQRTR